MGPRSRVPFGTLLLHLLVFSLWEIGFLVGHADSAAAASAADSEEALEDEPLAVLRDDPVDLSRDALAPLEEVTGAPPGFARRAEEARALRPFRRLEDLLVVPGVDGEFLARLGPYVVAPDDPAPLRGRLVARATAGDLAGGARSAEIATFRRGDALEFGGALERDAGEDGLADARTAWFVARRGGARVLLGDLDVEWGLGLALASTPAPRGLDGRARRALRPGRGLAPHRGTGEERHFRGGAVGWRAGAFALEALATGTRRDARVRRDGRVTSLVGTGLHRTSPERAARDRLRDETLALRAGLSLAGGAAIAATARVSAYDPPLGPRDGSSLPTGARERILAADFALPAGPARLVGEVATRGGGGAARIVAVEASAERARVVLVARRLDPEFRALHLAPPAHFARASNEEGALLFGEARFRSLRVEAGWDAWGEIAPPSTGAARVRGEEFTLEAEAVREGASAGARLTRRTEREGSRETLRDAVRASIERPLGRGVSARFLASAVARAGGPRDPERGGALQSTLALSRRSGLRVALTVTRYAGDSGAVLPRTAEAILPGVVRSIALGSGARPAGWRALVAARRPLGPALRAAAAAALHAPRGGPARGEISFSLELGRANVLRRTALTPPASDP